jgi:hypothetical protein
MMGFYFGFVGTFRIGQVFRLKFHQEKTGMMTENVYKVYIFFFKFTGNYPNKQELSQPNHNLNLNLTQLQPELG